MEISEDSRVALLLMLLHAGYCPTASDTVRLESRKLFDQLQVGTRDRGAAHRSTEVACVAAQLSLPTVSMDDDGHIELEMRQEDPPVIVVIGGNRGEMIHLFQRLTSAFLERLMRGQPASAARG